MIYLNLRFIHFVIAMVEDMFDNRNRFFENLDTFFSRYDINFFTAHGSEIRWNKMCRDHTLLNSHNESMWNPKDSPVW